jgi:ElaB/YqjD/DUF883 family membrane-anchored ribosome-binding protein
MMFSGHSSAAAIESHLHGIEHELKRVARKASRNGSARVSSVRQQIAETIPPILDEISGLLGTAPRLAAKEAERFRDDAIKAGRRLGNEAVDRIASEVAHRPLVVLGLALGVGILIGVAGRHRMQT